jgi:predicted RNase H-like HicB family nuclease
LKARLVFNIQLPYAVKRNGVSHVAWCPALDVYSQGPSHRKAVANLADALRLFLMSCYERGTLDQVLRESGFRPAAPTRRTSTKRAVSKGFDTLMVPLPFLVDMRRKELCLA